MNIPNNEVTLSAKQRCFLQEYLVDLNVTKAAIRAAFDLHECVKEKSYYVYLLVDGENDEIFYVGKGKNMRHAQHVREWNKSKYVNSQKSYRIGRIIESGNSVVAYCLATGLSEDDAYSIERCAITAIGKSLLTNASSGQLTEKQRSIFSAKLLLLKIASFKEWCVRHNPTSKEMIMYSKVVNSLQKISEDGYIRELRVGKKHG